MKNRIFGIIFLLITTFSYCQKEHLIPASDFSTKKGILKEYYDNLFPLLYKNFQKKPFAKYTSMPSFGEEYAFSTEVKGSKFVIISNTFSESYWYSKNRRNVKLITKRKEISESLFKKIGELFQLLAIQTKKSEKESMGSDGVTYYFSTTNSKGEIKNGEAWSPHKGSKLEKLTEICDDLFFIGIGKGKSEKIIEKEIEELIIVMKH